jgi:tetratricopeptide (TPR) repeat protein
VAKRRRIRKERDEYFKRIDELLKANDYNEVINTFNNIIRLSRELGENTIAQELTQRSQSYSQEINQMAQRIPELRSQRSEALNQAEMSELSGNYLQAAEQFAVAAELSAEIGEYDKAKDYVNQAERLKGLSELAKLRERLR